MIRGTLAAFVMPWRAARKIRELGDGLHASVTAWAAHLEREHPEGYPRPGRHLHVVR